MFIRRGGKCCTDIDIDTHLIFPYFAKNLMGKHTYRTAHGGNCGKVAGSGRRSCWQELEPQWTHFQARIYNGGLVMAQHNKERRYNVIVVTTTATLPKHAPPSCSLQIMFCISTVRYIYYISISMQFKSLVNNTTPIRLTSQMSHYNRRN